ncbi:rRNA biogenesis protein rrp5 [Ruminococcus sp. AF42-9BH]|nr:rRNA biogenesis protein rrp5 [Mediterraneibacter faecis]MCI7723375.1 rRNA biogenesis protein rrp5 [Mediterraneibacter faecis]RHO87326.1 rRNA biogenesis protein rrp5 [Ruminococcus sp. AF42-9BH]
MTNNQKYNLFLDAVRIIRSLADVFEAIADTYRDATVVEADAKVIDAQEVKELPAEKEVTLEDVRAVLGQKSQAGMTAEVRELIRKYGGTRLSDIDPAQYKALLAEAEVLGNE